LIIDLANFSTSKSIKKIEEKKKNYKSIIKGSLGLEVAESAKMEVESFDISSI
jgi:hypothetical protein